MAPGVEAGGPILAEPLRIVVVAPPWYEIPPRAYGGIERVCFELVQGLVRRGHDVTLVGCGRHGTEARFLQVLPEPPPGLGTLEASVQELRYAAATAALLEDVECDLIHDHSLSGPLTWHTRRVPTLITAHGPVDGALGDYFRWLGLPIVATSNAQRKTAPALQWAATIHNGIDVHRFPFQAKKDGYVLFLGRLSPDKGAHIAVEAAQLAGIPIIVAGKSSEPGEQRYLDEQVLPRLGPRDTWVGEVAGARRDDLLARANCVLAPVQWDEPFGLVYAEALACGTPVIGTPRGSIPEIVADGETGWVCETIEDLAAAVERCPEVDAWACRARALRFFDNGVMVERYDRLYHEVMTAARA